MTMTMTMTMTKAKNKIAAAKALADKDGVVNPKDLLGMKKPPLSLIPLAGMLWASLAHLDGALKYGPFNWREYPIKKSIYLDAILRHLKQYQEGERCASDSGVHHLGHIMACCGIMLDAETMGLLIDDLPHENPGLDTLMAEVTQLVEERIEKEKEKEEAA